MFTNILRNRTHSILSKHCKISLRPHVFSQNYLCNKLHRSFATKMDSSTYYDYINPNGYIKKLQVIQDEMNLKEARVDYHKNPHKIENLAKLILCLNRSKQYKESLEIAKVNYMKVFVAKNTKIPESDTNLWEQINLAHTRIRKKPVISYY